MAELFKRVGGALDAGERRPAEGVFLSPQWSPDDRWIHFWYVLGFGPDTDACDVTIARLDVGAGEFQEVLAKPQLIALIGFNRYRSFAVCGGEPGWRLSPDGDLALVQVLDTIDTNPGLLILSLDEGSDR